MVLSHLVQPVKIGAWLREPVVHFAGIGAAIFAIQAWSSDLRHDVSDLSLIKVDVSVLNEIKREWKKDWGRAPSSAELRSQVEKFIDDEIMYREAKLMGLDQEDTIVRRRMIQKMAFLYKNPVPPREPDPSELLEAMERYRKNFPTLKIAPVEIQQLARLQLLAERQERDNQETVKQLRSRYEVRVLPESDVDQ